MIDQDPNEHESNSDADQDLTRNSGEQNVDFTYGSAAEFEAAPDPSMTSGPDQTGQLNLPPVLLPVPLRAMGWLLLFTLTYIVATVFYFIGYGFYLGITLGSDGIEKGLIEELIQAHMISPDGLSGMYLLQFVFVVPMIIIASSFKQQNWGQTLAVKWIAQNKLFYWVGMWLLYQVVFMVLGNFVDVDTDDFVLQMEGSKHIGMFVTVVVLAPIMEELLFRGYLFKACRDTWLGFYGTLLITSTLFCLMHLGQYNWWALSQVFVLALLLGVAREKTGSLVTAVVIHGLNNLLAAVFIIFLGVS